MRHGVFGRRQILIGPTQKFRHRRRRIFRIFITEAKDALIDDRCLPPNQTRIYYYLWRWYFLLSLPFCCCFIRRRRGFAELITWRSQFVHWHDNLQVTVRCILLYIYFSILFLYLYRWSMGSFRRGWPVWSWSFEVAAIKGIRGCCSLHSLFE